MATNKELIQAAKLLKENCAGRECDKNCPFFTSVEEFEHERTCCSFGFRSNPLAWEFPKPRRWTDADIQLAKALKAFGVKEVYKKEDEYGTYALDRNSGSELALPDSAFTSLQSDETVSIDSILKEAEE